MENGKINILMVYDEEEQKEKKDILSTFEEVQTELDAWKIKYEKTGGKDKKRGYIEKIENNNFVITVAPYQDMIEMSQADSIYANTKQKKQLKETKAKYFDYGLQVLVDIVLEAKKTAK